MCHSGVTINSNNNVPYSNLWVKRQLVEVNDGCSLGVNVFFIRKCLENFPGRKFKCKESKKPIKLKRVKYNETRVAEFTIDLC